MSLFSDKVPSDEDQSFLLDSPQNQGKPLADIWGRCLGAAESKWWPRWRWRRWPSRWRERKSSWPEPRGSLWWGGAGDDAGYMFLHRSQLFRHYYSLHVAISDRYSLSWKNQMSVLWLTNIRPSPPIFALNDDKFWLDYIYFFNVLNSEILIFCWNVHCELTLSCVMQMVPRQSEQFMSEKKGRFSEVFALSLSKGDCDKNTKNLLWFCQNM